MADVVRIARELNSDESRYYRAVSACGDMSSVEGARERGIRGRGRGREREGGRERERGREREAVRR